MDISRIKEQLRSITDLSSIYLLETLSNKAGFFANDSKILYMAKDINGYPYEGIETEYLKLQTHIRISAVKNNQTFEDGYYNLIIYKGSMDDPNLNSFIQLCVIHAINSDELSFKEFFYSLISIFQLPTEQAFINIIGLYGELKFMEYVYNHLQIDISDSWHRNGSYSKYDFSNGNESIEIKTTLSDNSEIVIKHQQIFGSHPCTLVVVKCNKYENGETVEELMSSMYKNSNAFKGMNFSINLAKELKRVAIKDVRELRFEIKDILFFNSNEINPFPFIPESVDRLVYNLDISEMNPMSKDCSEKILKQFE